MRDIGVIVELVDRYSGTILFPSFATALKVDHTSGKFSVPHVFSSPPEDKNAASEAQCQ